MSFWQKLSYLHKPFLALAPMDGVTDFVFRELISETAKPDVLYTEFTNVEALCSKGFEKTIPRLRFSDKQRPIVAQIWGTKPENFLKVGKMVLELGFDGVDLNMGCPDRAVMKIGLGAACINNHCLASEIIKATKEGVVDLPVSVKTRIGLKNIATEEWIGFLLTKKLAALAIHGRTAAELSKVPAHWEEIGKAIKMKNQISPETIIIGNGDIRNLQQAEKMYQKYGVDGVMIGTGIFSNPWFFEKPQRIHSSKENLELLLKHTKLFCDTYSYRNSFSVMKKFFKIYVKSFRGADDLKIQLMETKSFEEVEGLVREYLITY